MRLIDTDELENRPIFIDDDEWEDTFDDGLLFVCDLIDKSPTVDAVPVVRCKDCKHKPIVPQWYENGFDIEFPDDICPCQCDDKWYSWCPDDNWFCGSGEPKEEDK